MVLLLERVIQSVPHEYQARANYIHNQYGYVLIKLDLQSRLQQAGESLRAKQGVCRRIKSTSTEAGVVKRLEEGGILSPDTSTLELCSGQDTWSWLA